MKKLSLVQQAREKARKDALDRTQLRQLLDDLVACKDPDEETLHLLGHFGIEFNAEKFAEFKKLQQPTEEKMS